MAGPIQTSFNKLIGLASGAIAASKKMIDDEGQTISAEEQAKIERSKALAAKKAKRAEDKEKSSLVSIYRTAERKGLAKIQNLIFDDSGEAVATYNEIASLLSDQALSSHLESRKNTRSKIKARKIYLEQVEKQRRGGNK